VTPGKIIWGPSTDGPNTLNYGNILRELSEPDFEYELLIPLSRNLSLHTMHPAYRVILLVFLPKTRALTKPGSVLPFLRKTCQAPRSSLAFFTQSKNCRNPQVCEWHHRHRKGAVPTRVTQELLYSVFYASAVQYERTAGQISGLACRWFSLPCVMAIACRS